MKNIVILIAAAMVLVMAVGCTTTIPQKNIPAVVKPKTCK